MRSVLITGGTGSFGHAMVSHLLAHDMAERIVVFSRDELKQAMMADRFGPHTGGRMRYFIGDVRDRDRVRLAMRGVDTVIHAAALKRVESGIYNPCEVVKTNVLGSQNVIEAALDSGVARCVLLSSDKACAPLNLYGATKATAEALFSAASSYAGGKGPLFACVRYGNVMGSRGSVVPLWRDRIAKGEDLPVTDAEATRFWFELPGAVGLVLDALQMMAGGETFVPDLPAFRVVDLARAMGGTVRDCGKRPGDKQHESMISVDEAPYFRRALNPMGGDWYVRGGPGVPLPEGFVLRSDLVRRMDVAELRAALKSLDSAGGGIA